MQHNSRKVIKSCNIAVR